MAYEFIIYEKKDHIAYVTLNRPELLNAINPPMSKELSDAFADFTEDPDARVAIVTGAGDRAFCAGADLKWRSEHPEEETTERDTRRDGVARRGIMRTEIWKPLIAAVNGYAVGGGMEVTLICDVVIASETAQFGVPEVRNAGGLPGEGGILRLPRQLPHKVAMWMLLSGQLMSPQYMHSVGYVNDVVPPDKLMETAEYCARVLCDNPPIGVQTSKEVALRALDLPIDYPSTAWQNQWNGITARMRDSEDRQESRRAWLEKRKPVYHNR